MNDKDLARIKEINKDIQKNISINLNATSIINMDEKLRLRKAYLCRCLSGSNEIELDFEKYHIEKDDTLIIFPHQTFIEKPDQFFYANIVTISDAFFVDVIHGIPSEFCSFLRTHPIFHLTQETELSENEHFYRVTKLIYDDEANFCKKMILYNLIQNHYLHIYNAIYLKMQNNKEHHSRKEEQMNSFMALLGNNYKKQRDVNFYADSLCITPKYLSIITKSCTGHNAKTVIDNYIISEIKMMLRTTNMDLKHIAEELNFPDQTFMSKYFKNRVGISPKSWRLQG